MQFKLAGKYMLRPGLRPADVELLKREAFEVCGVDPLYYGDINVTGDAEEGPLYVTVAAIVGDLGEISLEALERAWLWLASRIGVFEEAVEYEIKGERRLIGSQQQIVQRIKADLDVKIKALQQLRVDWIFKGQQPSTEITRVPFDPDNFERFFEMIPVPMRPAAISQAFTESQQLEGAPDLAPATADADPNGVAYLWSSTEPQTEADRAYVAMRDHESVLEGRRVTSYLQAALQLPDIIPTRTQFGYSEPPQAVIAAQAEADVVAMRDLREQMPADLGPMQPSPMPTPMTDEQYRAMLNTMPDGVQIHVAQMETNEARGMINAREARQRMQELHRDAGFEAELMNHPVRNAARQPIQEMIAEEDARALGGANPPTDDEIARHGQRIAEIGRSYPLNFNDEVARIRREETPLEEYRTPTPVEIAQHAPRLGEIGRLWDRIQQGQTPEDIQTRGAVTQTFDQLTADWIVQPGAFGDAVRLALRENVNRTRDAAPETNEHTYQLQLNQFLQALDRFSRGLRAANLPAILARIDNVLLCCVSTENRPRMRWELIQLVQNAFPAPAVPPVTTEVHAAEPEATENATDELLPDSFAYSAEFPGEFICPSVGSRGEIRLPEGYDFRHGADHEVLFDSEGFARIFRMDQLPQTQHYREVSGEVYLIPFPSVEFSGMFIVAEANDARLPEGYSFVQRAEPNRGIQTTMRGYRVCRRFDLAPVTLLDDNGRLNRVASVEFPGEFVVGPGPYRLPDGFELVMGRNQANELIALRTECGFRRIRSIDMEASAPRPRFNGPSYSATRTGRFRTDQPNIANVPNHPLPVQGTAAEPIRETPQLTMWAEPNVICASCGSTMRTGYRLSGDRRLCSRCFGDGQVRARFDRVSLGEGAGPRAVATADLQRLQRTPNMQNVPSRSRSVFDARPIENMQVNLVLSPEIADQATTRRFEQRRASWDFTNNVSVDCDSSHTFEGFLLQHRREGIFQCECCAGGMEDGVRLAYEAGWLCLLCAERLRVWQADRLAETIVEAATPVPAPAVPDMRPETVARILLRDRSIPDLNRVVNIPTADQSRDIMRSFRDQARRHDFMNPYLGDQYDAQAFARQAAYRPPPADVPLTTEPPPAMGRGITPEEV